MAFVEILDVALSDLDAEQLQGRNIEAPKADSRIYSDMIHGVGWVLGRSSPAVTVEGVHDGTVLQSTLIDLQRPDVTDAFPGVHGAEQSGFRTNVVVPNSGEFELLVRAVLQDEGNVSLGVIQARQRRNDQEQKDGSSAQDRSGRLVQERSGPFETFFRRLLGRGSG
jgi:hypothetical protein